VIIRTSRDPEALIPVVQQTIHDADPGVATKFTTMDALVSDSIGAQRFRTVLAAIFAVLALLLALSGMYAVVSYTTAQRTPEFGLRSALGAQRGNIIRLVLREATAVAAIGVIAGVVLSVGAGRLLASMLFGVQSLDAVTYGVVVAIIFPVIVLAAVLPAWRASRVDPVSAIRCE
jgi:putative ABC transport system permease protein